MNPGRDTGTREQAAREAAVEVMARAYYNWCSLIPNEPSRWDEPDESGGFSHKLFARARAAVMLDALLAPRTETCPTCGGNYTSWPPPTRQLCPDCSNGQVSGAPLLVLYELLDEAVRCIESLLDEEDSDVHRNVADWDAAFANARTTLAAIRVRLVAEEDRT